MKKLFISFLFVLVGVNFVSALPNECEVILQVRDVNPGGTLGGHPRTPIARPSVAQDGHTLYFNNVGYDLELVLLDEDGEEAYAVSVPANTASVILPASLSGDYELQLYPGGSYYFYSERQPDHAEFRPHSEQIWCRPEYK